MRTLFLLAVSARMGLDPADFKPVTRILLNPQFCDQNIGYVSLCLTFAAMMSFQYPPDHPDIQAVPCNNAQCKRNVFSTRREP